MRNKSLLSLLLLLSRNILWASPSLFFTSKEISFIQQNMFSNILVNPFAQAETISLSAIVYIDENHWTLWVNNIALRPQTVHEMENLKIMKVQPQDVTFLWAPHHTTTPKTFTLHPGQTYESKDTRLNCFTF